MPVELNKRDQKYYPIYNPGYAILVSPIIFFDVGLRSVLKVPLPKWPIEHD